MSPSSTFKVGLRVWWYGLMLAALPVSVVLVVAAMHYGITRVRAQPTSADDLPYWRWNP
jgi:hypothetical protein